jgi:hypothetical protein
MLTNYFMLSFPLAEAMGSSQAKINNILVLYVLYKDDLNPFK